MPDSPLPTGPEALAFVHRYLPQVLRADERQPAARQQARQLGRIARQQLQRHYGSTPALLEARTVLDVLEQVETRLQSPPAAKDWLYARTQLGRVMPLVERLLAA